MRGFSLLESMIAMGLAFLVLGLLAVLMREYSGVSRFARSRDATLDGVQFALREMRNELGSALEVTAPGAIGSSESRLEFTRLNPDPELDRIPDTFPAPVPPSWAHADPTHLIDVRYLIEDGELVRRVEGLPAPSRQVVASSIDSLRVDRQSQRLYLITVSFQELNRLKRYSLLSKRWVAPRAIGP